jgi:hypothetical protein
MKQKVDSLGKDEKTVILKGVIPAKAESPAPSADIQEVNERIAAKAYELYEKRGYVHGHDWEDWFEAERLVLSRSRPGK